MLKVLLNILWNSKVAFLLSFIVCPAVHAAAANPVTLPTLKDGWFGVALDGIISLSEVFIAYMIGAIVVYRIGMWITNKELKLLKLSLRFSRNFFRLLEIYIKGIALFVCYSVISLCLLKLDRSFYLYNFFYQYIYAVTIVVSIIHFIYVFLAPKHESSRIISLENQDASTVYNSISFALLITLLGYCTVELVKDMGGFDAEIVDKACRCLILLCYIYELFKVRHILPRYTKKLGVIYVGSMSEFSKYMNKHCWIVAICVIALFFSVHFLDQGLYLSSFIFDSLMLVSLIFGAQAISLFLVCVCNKYVNVFSVSFAKNIQKSWRSQFRKHVYLTTNAAVFAVYSLALYAIVDYLFDIQTMNILYIGYFHKFVQVVLQIYVIFLLYKYMSLYCSYRVELLYIKKAENATRLKTILPLALRCIEIALFTVGALTLLVNLGVNITPIITAILTLGVPISFAAQDTVKSLICGIIMLVENDFEIGDYVTVADSTGFVEYIGLRAMHVREKSGKLNIIPYFSVKTLSNYSRDFSNHYLEILCPPEENVDSVIELIREIGKEISASPEFSNKVLEDIRILGIRGFDANSTKIAWSMRTLPDPFGALRYQFYTLFRQKLFERGMRLPIYMDVTVNPELSRYV